MVVVATWVAVNETMVKMLVSRASVLSEIVSKVFKS